MYLAEICGKLSTENENKEDILTSNVFSFFKYSDRKIFLLQFLHSLGLKISLDEALDTKILFWPSFPDGTEPDLVIITGDYYILVEAKYHSRFGKATLTRKHQLVREIEGGAFEAENLDKKFVILIVTADSYFKREIFKDIPHKHKQDLKWINWQKITYLICSILEHSQNISSETRLFAEDLYSLLIKKNLRNYEGTDVLGNIRKLLIPPDNLFFQANTALYRGDFIGFTPVLEIFPKLSYFPNAIFFGNQRLFFQIPSKLNTTKSDTTGFLFYKECERNEKI